MVRRMILNAHPHMSMDGTLAVVHNGIVENFAALRSELVRKGYVISSDTDTELIAHLIADVRKQKWMPLEEAVRQAMTQVHGAYGIAVLCSDEPDMLIGARNGSPLILGIGEENVVHLGIGCRCSHRAHQEGDIPARRRDLHHQSQWSGRQADLHDQDA